jgi:hypothetical protein
MGPIYQRRETNDDPNHIGPSIRLIAIVLLASCLLEK